MRGFTRSRAILTAIIFVLILFCVETTFNQPNKRPLSVEEFGGCEPVIVIFDANAANHPTLQNIQKTTPHTLLDVKSDFISTVKNLSTKCQLHIAVVEDLESHLKPHSQFRKFLGNTKISTLLILVAKSNTDDNIWKKVQELIKNEKQIWPDKTFFGDMKTNNWLFLCPFCENMLTTKEQWNKQINNMNVFSVKGEDYSTKFVFIQDKSLRATQKSNCEKLAFAKNYQEFIAIGCGHIQPLLDILTQDLKIKYVTPVEDLPPSKVGVIHPEVVYQDYKNTNPSDEQKDYVILIGVDSGQISYCDYQNDFKKQGINEGFWILVSPISFGVWILIFCVLISTAILVFFMHRLAKKR